MCTHLQQDTHPAADTLQVNCSNIPGTPRRPCRTGSKRQLLLKFLLIHSLWHRTLNSMLAVNSSHCSLENNHWSEMKLFGLKYEFPESLKESNKVTWKSVITDQCCRSLECVYMVNIHCGRLLGLDLKPQVVLWFCTRSKSKHFIHQTMSCPLLCLIQQGDESVLQFLPASDSRGLEKKPGRTKKLWMGLSLLLAAVCIALLTGLLVWHFHRELLSIKLYLNTSIAVGCANIRSKVGEYLWDIQISMKEANKLK